MNDQSESPINAGGAELPDPIKPVGAAAEAIALRIEQERNRLAGEEDVERHLTAERKRLLVEGTDVEVDAVEQRIDASRSAQIRILERVELLTAQLVQANEAAESATLDAIADRARRVQAFATNLIGVGYKRVAGELAAIFRKLAAAQSVIDDANRTLERAGRELVPGAEECRRLVGGVVRRKELVTVTPGDPLHPCFGKWSPPMFGKMPEQVRNSETGETFPFRFEVEREVEERFPGHWPPSLLATELPGAEPADPFCYTAPIWSGQKRRPSGDEIAEDVAALLAEVEKTPRTTGRKGASS